MSIHTKHNAKDCEVCAAQQEADAVDAIPTVGHEPEVQPQGVELLSDTFTEQLFQAWWKVNHPWDWWAKDRNGQPLPLNDRILVAELCRRAFHAAVTLACAGLPRATAAGDTKSDDLVNCPDCVEGKITVGCAIDKPLISVDCGRCKGMGRIKLPTINLPFSMDDIRRNASTLHATGETTVEAVLAELREIHPKRWITVTCATRSARALSTKTAWTISIDQVVDDFEGATLADCVAQVRAAAQTSYKSLDE